MIKDSSRTIISFDGQAQGQDRGILLLDNNQDSRDILLCFGKWVYLGKNHGTLKIHLMLYTLQRFGCQNINRILCKKLKEIQEHIIHPILKVLWLLKSTVKY